MLQLSPTQADTIYPDSDGSVDSSGSLERSACKKLTDRSTGANFAILISL